MKVFTHITTYREDLPFEVWFTRILVNGCLDLRKARARRLRWALPMTLIGRPARARAGRRRRRTPKARLISDERTQTIGNAIDRLPNRQREVFTLCHIAEQTHRRSERGPWGSARRRCACTCSAPSASCGRCCRARRPAHDPPPPHRHRADRPSLRSRRRRRATPLRAPAPSSDHLPRRADAARGTNRCAGCWTDATTPPRRMRMPRSRPSGWRASSARSWSASSSDAGAAASSASPARPAAARRRRPRPARAGWRPPRPPASSSASWAGT